MWSYLLLVCINILIKVYDCFMQAVRTSEREQNGEINADAVCKVKHGIVSHWFSPLTVCADINSSQLLTLLGNGIPSITSWELFSCKRECDQNSYKISFKMICLLWGLRCRHIGSSSPIVVHSSAFCHGENWQCGIKLACLSFLRETCPWSVFSVSETTCISAFVADVQEKID